MLNLGNIINTSYIFSETLVKLFKISKAFGVF